MKIGLGKKLVSLMTRSLVLIVCTMSASLSGSLQAAEMIWTGDFETGDFSQYRDKFSGLDTRSTKRLVTSPVRGGRYATELTILGVGSSGIERAELQSAIEQGGGLIKFDWDGPEYWVGFSFLFKEWDANAHTFFQLHSPNNPGSDCRFSGNTFSVWGDGEDSNDGIADEVAVRVIRDGGVSRDVGAASNNDVIHKYPIPLNEWQDYVVNFRLSTNGTGFYKIWKNGELIFSENGLTNVNSFDSCGKPVPEEKRSHNGAHIGVYSPGNPAYRRIFYDEVRVATGANGYDLVSPDQSGAPAEPAPPEPVKPNPPVIEQAEP